MRATRKSLRFLADRHLNDEPKETLVCVSKVGKIEKTSVIHIDRRVHAAFKAFCQEHGLRMGEVAERLIRHAIYKGAGKK